MVRAATRWPTNPSELGAALADQARFSELFPDSAPQAWTDFARSYSAVSPHVAEQIQLEVQQALQSMGTAPNVPLSVPAGTMSVPAGTGRKAWHKRPAGTALDSLAAGRDRPWTRFLHAADPRREDEQSLRDRYQLVNGTGKGAAGNRIMDAAMSERTPAGGGFLVPEVMRAEILANVLEQSIVRPRARVVPMDSLRVPLPVVDDESHVAGVYGGVSAYWTAEGATLSATAPKWGRLELEARKLTAYTTIPNELLQDSVTPLDEWFGMFFPRAMAWFEDLAFISGSGVGEPQGFLNSPAAVKVPAATAHIITLTDVIAVLCRIYPPLLTSPGLVWLCSPDTKQQLLSMTLTGGSGPNAVAPPAWLAGMQAIDAPQPRLFGIDLIVSEKMPSSLAGNTAVPGALALVDLNSYLLGDRQSMQLATSEEFLFASDLVAYRVTERLDGRIWNQSAITPANGAATLSPVVLLDTTGS